MKTFPLFVVLLAFSLAAQAAPWSGKWDTTWGEASKVTRLVMKQKGKEVTGQYQYLNGRIIGVVEGKILRGSWAQSNGAKGDFVFELSGDDNSFSGKWRAGHKGRWNPDAWNGVRAD